MTNDDQFRELINQSYRFEGESFQLGMAMIDDHVVDRAEIHVPLSTLNRHGLIAGATGTGKTKTLQVLAENLREHGVAVLLLDIKGDLSGLAQPGTINEKIRERYEKFSGETWASRQYPVEFWSISEEKGVRLRSTLAEFGPMLLGKILELNETQNSFISLVFKYCDDQHLPLIDLNDFLRVLHYISNEGKQEIEEIYGKIVQSSIGTIVRKTIELQQQNVDRFFGEPSLNIQDFLHPTKIHIVRVTDMQEKTKLFSTFMLSLLKKFYNLMPEIGDTKKPKVMIFIDEAHLLFQQSIEPLLRQIETIIKLIRSKGIGILFSTQNPTDIPASILTQLGMKIQHALRATTAKDRKNIKQISENFPLTQFYRVDQLLTQLRIGEALVTFLNEQGQPTTLAVCLLCTPRSRLTILQPDEIDRIVGQSSLVTKYAQRIERDGAEKILSRKKPSISHPPTKTERTTIKKQSRSMLDKVLNSATSRQVGRTATTALTRGLLSSIGLTGTTTKRTNRRKRRVNRV